MNIDWDVETGNYLPGKREIRINGITYLMDDNWAALSHVFMLMIEAIENKG